MLTILGNYYEAPVRVIVSNDGTPGNRFEVEQTDALSHPIRLDRAGAERLHQLLGCALSVDQRRGRP